MIFQNTALWRHVAAAGARGEAVAPRQVASADRHRQPAAQGVLRRTPLLRPGVFVGGIVNCRSASMNVLISGTFGNRRSCFPALDPQQGTAPARPFSYAP